MARAKLPPQCPPIPAEIYKPVNDIYIWANGLERDIGTYVSAPVNELRTSTVTISLSAYYYFNVIANARYNFEFLIFAEANFRYRLVGPAAAPMRMYRYMVDATGAATHSLYTVPDTVDQTFAANRRMIKLEGTINTSVNAGQVGISWAQDTSSGTSSIIVGGSYVKYSRIA